MQDKPGISYVRKQGHAKKMIITQKLLYKQSPHQIVDSESIRIHNDYDILQHIYPYDSMIGW